MRSSVSTDSCCRKMLMPVKWLNRATETRRENEILRRRVPRVIATSAERARLIHLGQAIGIGVNHLITVVTYET